MLTLERAKELVEYDPSTGEFYHRTARGGVTVGTSARTRASKGYFCVKLDGVRYRAGRLAFFMMTGRWPEPEIDHIDRNPRNDSWLNLRESTRQGNIDNRSDYSNSTTKVRGVDYVEKDQVYRARVQSLGVRKTLGYYQTLKQAEEAITSFRSNGGV